MSKSRVFLLFAALQVCDVLTTLLFLRHGVREANPLMGAAIAVASHTLIALAVPKLVALGLALYAARSGRTRLLAGVNVRLTCCVPWDLLALAVRGGRIHRRDAETRRKTEKVGPCSFASWLSDGE